MPIIDFLVKIGYLVVNHNYKSTYSANNTNKYLRNIGRIGNVKAESKKYSLTPLAISKGICKVGVLSKKTEYKLKAYKKDIIESYLLDKQIHSKILFNTTELYFDDKKALPYLDKVLNDHDTSEGKAKFYKEKYNSLIAISKCKTMEEHIQQQGFYYIVSKKVNRVFAYYSNIPKEFRYCFNHKDGSKLAEIDKSNSLPFIMAMEYLNEKYKSNETNEHTYINNNVNDAKQDIRYNIRGNKEDRVLSVLVRFNDNDKKLYNDVVNGDLYKSIAEEGLKNNDVEFYNLFNDSYTDFKTEVLAKGLFCKLLPLKAIKKAERYLMNIYPDFANYQRNTKQAKGFESPSIESQIIESELIVNNIFIELEHGNEFATPLHDALMVKVNDVELFKSKLIDIFKNRFPMLEGADMNKLFKVTYYEK